MSDARWFPLEVRYEARCRYCGDSWEIDLGSDYVSDEEFLEVTRNKPMYVVCENCERSYLG
ncbi:hypothetical protein ALPO108162_02930 [Alicyclobacillus pomorum]|jgi:hypothetical protein